MVNSWLKSLLTGIKNGDDKSPPLDIKELKKELGAYQKTEENRSHRRANLPIGDVNVQIYPWEDSRTENEEKLSVHGKITNLSVSGAAIFIDQKSDWIEKDTFLKALLSAHHVGEIPVKIQVVRVHERIIGAKIIEFLEESGARQLNRLIEPILLGDSIREINSERLDKGTEETPVRWFQGKNDTNIFLWSLEDKETADQIQFVFMDYVIEWKQGKKIKVGEVVDSGPERIGYGRVDPCLISFYGIPAPDILNLARAIISGFEGDQEVRSLIKELVADGERRYFSRLKLFDSVKARIGENEGVVVDLSYNGFSFTSETPMTGVYRGQSVNAELTMPWGDMSLEASISHKTEHFLGAHILNLPEEMKDKLRDYLRDKFIGDDLAENLITS